MNLKEAKDIFKLKEVYTRKDVKSKYRVLLKENHPDKNSNSLSENTKYHNKTIKIIDAYNFILNNFVFLEDSIGTISKDDDYQYDVKTDEKSKKEIFDEYLQNYLKNIEDFDLNIDNAFRVQLIVIFMPIVWFIELHELIIGRIDYKIVRRLLNVILAFSICYFIWVNHRILFDGIFTGIIGSSIIFGYTTLLMFFIRKLIVKTVNFIGLNYFEKNVQLKINLSSVIYILVYYIMIFFTVKLFLSAIVDFNNWKSNLTYNSIIISYLILISYLAIRETIAFIYIIKLIRSVKQKINGLKLYQS
jgi:hypothetical protein